MKDEKIRQGATFEVTLTDTILTADTATITISDADGDIVAQETESFALVDEVPTVTLRVDTTDIEVGEYEYMYTINYSDPAVVKLPDVSKCGDEPCALPAFVVCVANDIPQGS